MAASVVSEGQYVHKQKSRPLNGRGHGAEYTCTGKSSRGAMADQHQQIFALACAAHSSIGRRASPAVCVLPKGQCLCKQNTGLLNGGGRGVGHIHTATLGCGAMADSNSKHWQLRLRCALVHRPEGQRGWFCALRRPVCAKTKGEADGQRCSCFAWRPCTAHHTQLPGISAR